MKFQTTRKAIANGTSAEDLFQCGYCDMYYLLRNHSPISYTCGVYGWNFDIYSIHGLTITTGYRNMCGKKIPFDLLRNYNKECKKIWDDYSVPYDVRSENAEKLLIEFCNILKGE